MGSLTGCGSQTVEQTAQDEKTDGEVTITIWHDKEDAVTQVLEEEFTQLEPQIHVVLEKKSDLTEALKWWEMILRQLRICTFLLMIR